MPTWRASKVGFPIGLLLLPRFTTALQVTPGSSCAAICQDNGVSSTNSSDIVCNDADFFSTPTGTKFKNCMECLQDSNAVNGDQNDLSWFLYNLRYTLDVCLWSFPSSAQNSTVQCATDVACNPLRAALETGDLVPGNETQYQYCTVDGGTFEGSQTQCSQCLQSTSVNLYLSNFVEALYAGCEQQPAPGALLSLTSDLFSQSALNGTTASASATAAASSSSSSGSLPTAAIIGISAGIGGLFLGVIILFWIYWMRQRRFDAEDQLERMLARRFGGPPDGGSSLTATHPDGLEPMDFKKDGSVNSDDHEHMSDFNTNAEYYAHACKGSMGPIPAFAASGIQQQSNPGQVTSMLPAHPAYLPRIASKHESRDVREPVVKFTPPPSRLRGHETDASGEESGIELAPTKSQKPAPTPAPAPAPAPTTQTVARIPIQIQTTKPPATYRIQRDYPPAKEPSPIELSQEHPAFSTPKYLTLHGDTADNPPAIMPLPIQTQATQTLPPAGMTLQGQFAPPIVLPASQKWRATQRYSPTLLKLQGREDETISGPLAAPPAVVLASDVSGSERERDESASGSEAMANRRRRDTSVNDGGGSGSRPRRDASSSSMLGTNRERRRLSLMPQPGGPNDKIVEHTVDRQQYSEMPIVSGKSLLYG